MLLNYYAIKIVMVSDTEVKYLYAVDRWLSIIERGGTRTGTEAQLECHDDIELGEELYRMRRNL
jgi:hypothetical protein